MDPVQKTEIEERKNLEIEIEWKLQWRSILFNKWLESRRDLDKSLLTLSAGGIGLLITLFSVMHEDLTLLAVVPGILALSSFLMAVIVLVNIMRIDADRILVAYKENKELPNENLNQKAYLSFLAGIVFSILYAVIATVTKF